LAYATLAGASGGIHRTVDRCLLDTGEPARAEPLESVTCVSTADCWAVGDTPAAPGGAATGVIENWNGSAWSVVASQAQESPTSKV